ncbi:MAG TPA: type II toxin-antitoxin system PemK/MazF family toxin [bacterium]|nr:type II toxin-antitoxin system PemK/MazF family toxin [bacterium]
MPDPILPKRWHLYVVDLEPRVRSKPGKQRPCLVIQPFEFAEGGLTSSVVIPLTTKLKGENAFPLRVGLMRGTCALKQDSELMIDQILAWDHSLFREDLGEIPEGLQDKVKEALREFLDL